MSQPIICFDLDGTLLDVAGNIHPNDVKLLAAEKPPALFVACTGRPLDSVRETFAKNGLFTGHKVPFPLVLQNGSLILGPQEERLAYLPFEPSVQRALIDCVKNFSQITFLFLSDQETLLLGAHPFGLGLVRKFEFSTAPFTPEVQRTAFGKLMCISQSCSALAAVERCVETLPVETAYSMPTIFEITPKDTNKGQGVKRLLHLLHLEDTPFCAAGDGENDLPLFTLAAETFAPISAPKTIKNNVSHLVDVQKNGLLSQMLNMVA